MRVAHLLRVLVLVGFSGFCVQATVVFAQPLRAYTVDDMLKVEGVGDVRISPGGASAIIEYQPPYDERGDYGVEPGGEILEIEFSDPSNRKHLFEHIKGYKYWLGDFSPSGRKLLVFAASRHETRAGVYDFDTKQFSLIDQPVLIEFRSIERSQPLWINDHEIVFSAKSEDWNFYKVRNGPYSADFLSSKWEQMFAGEMSGSVISTQPDDGWFEGSVVKYNVETDTFEELADGRFGGFDVSPDGRRLAAFRLGQRQQRYLANRITDFFRFETNMFVFDLENGTSISVLPSHNVSMRTFRWSTSGQKASFFAWNKSEEKRGGGHFTIDLNGANAEASPVLRVVPTWRGSYEPLRLPVPAEWLDENIVIHGVATQGDIANPKVGDGGLPSSGRWLEIDSDGLSARGGVIPGAEHSHQIKRLRDGRILLRSEEGHFVASAFEAILRVSFGNKGSVRILNGEDGSEIRSRVVFGFESEGVSGAGFYDLDTQRMHTFPLDRDKRVIAWSDVSRQLVVRSDDEKGGRLTVLEALAAPIGFFSFNAHVADFEHPKWTVVNYKRQDGSETFSCVLLPYDFDTDKAYPTIVDVYPTTGQECKLRNEVVSQPVGRVFNRMNLLSASGYLVLRPINTSERNQIDGEMYGGLTDQVDAALDALIKRGMTDPNRIGVWGFSNGSMASLWLVATSDRYKAVVPMFGATSPYFEYLAGVPREVLHLYMGRPIVHLVQLESEIGSMPLSMGRSALDDPVGYLDSGPLSKADQICAPVLMVQSDFDIFTTFHYEAMFAALYRLGKRAELVRYYGEGHGLRSPGNIRDFFERSISFFDKHVKHGIASSGCSIDTT